MSDPKIEKLHIIPLDKQVTIEVSGYFYRIAMAAYFNVIRLIGDKETEKLCKALVDNTVEILSQEEQQNASTIHMFLTLIKTIEEENKKAGFIIEQEIELPNEDSES